MTPIPVAELTETKENNCKEDENPSNYLDLPLVGENQSDSEDEKDTSNSMMKAVLQLPIGNLDAANEVAEDDAPDYLARLSSVGHKILNDLGRKRIGAKGTG